MSLANTALLIVDLQNDFLHGQGAYARGGQANADIAAHDVDAAAALIETLRQAEHDALDSGGPAAPDRPMPANQMESRSR